MKPAILVCIFAPAWITIPAFGQPLEWSDDFTTVTTYDSASLLAPCFGGNPTKYTLFDAWTTDVFNQHAVSGGGSLVITGRDEEVGTLGIPPAEFAMVGWLGLGVGCPGEPSVGTSSAWFTSDDLCIYGGFSFTPWHLDNASGWPWDPNWLGPDGQPGVANVDDDQDGTIDENDESPMRRPTSVNGGYGHSGSDAYQAGLDAAPGDADVDDDGNGTTDDYGEIGWPATDDGDDEQFNYFYAVMDASVATSSFVNLNLDPSIARMQFGLKEAVALTFPELEENNEIAPRFYQPHTHYNYAFCKSGTCYGAVLWTKRDLANPDETLGPILNSNHTGPTDNGVALTATGGTPMFNRQVRHRVNGNFSDTFWVCSGPPTMTDFMNGIFGYPSPSADLDNDRDVDVNDFLTFSGCFAGSLVPPAPGCQNAQADLDGDGDVDVNDFLTFSSCFNGSLKRPNAVCFPPDLTNCGS